MQDIKTYFWKDISIGMQADFSSTISEDDLNSFAILAGDHNPLHKDFNYAKSKGFSNRVAHGMLTSSLYSKLVGMYLPGKYALLQGIDILFLKPVYPQDILYVFGEVGYLNEAYKQLEICAYIKNQHAEKISKAKIRVGLLDD